MGAAMAAGSQLEKGIWALFVIAATIINITCSLRVKVSLEVSMFIIYQCPWFRVSAMATSNNASPIRLESAVSMPAASDFAFW